jgi:FkbM family methyltransferase
MPFSDTMVVKRLDAYDGPMDTVLDIGACWGQYTTAALNKGASRVIAVEPSDFNYAKILEIARASEGRVEPIHAAVTEVSGQIVGIRHIGDAVNSRHYTEQYPVAWNVVSISLNELLERFKPDLVKMDTEGDESWIFSTVNPDLLSGVSALDVEYHMLDSCDIYNPEDRPPHFDIPGFLESCGFKVDTAEDTSRPMLVRSGWIFAHR